MFDRRLVSGFDWTLFSLCLVLSVLGVVNLYSAGSAAPSLNSGVAPHYLKQIYWLLVGLGFLAVTVTVDYQLVARHAYLLHCLSLVLLLLALV